MNKSNDISSWYAPPEVIERRRLMEAIHSSPFATFDMLMKLIKVSYMMEQSAKANEPESSCSEKKINECV